MKSLLAGMLSSVLLAGTIGEAGEVPKTGIFPHGETQDGVAAFLLCHKHRFQIGEPIPLSYGFIFVGPGLNKKTEMLRTKVWQPLPPMDPNNFSWFEVTGPDGKNIPYSGENVSWPIRSPSDENTVLLHQGDFHGSTWHHLCCAFQMSKPGTYKVRWRWQYFGTAGVWGGKLTSNEVQFEIMSAKPPQAPAAGKSGETQGMGHLPHGKVKDGLAAFLTCQSNQFATDEPIALCYGLMLVGPTVDDRESQDTSNLKLRVWWLQNRPELSGNYSWFEVTGPDGQNVPYHGSTGTLRDSAPLDEFSVCLHYGQFVGTTHVDLRRNFDLSRPGTYKVRWGYKPWFKGGPWVGRLMSNDVQFEITGEKPPQAPAAGKSGETEGMSHLPHGKVKDGLAAFLTCQSKQFATDERIALCYGLMLVGPTVGDRESQDTSKLKLRVWWLQNRPELSGNYSWFEVTGPDGQNVPYHGGTGTLPDSAPLDEFSVCLHYGQFVGTTHVDLRRNFDLSRPGTYKVRWGYKPWFKGGPWVGKLMSNEVQFEILGEKPPQSPATGKSE